MIETVVSLETAKLLKERKFNVNTNAYYDDYNKLQVDEPNNDWNDPLYLGTICSAPTQSLAQKWLRDTQRIIVLVDYDSTDVIYWCNIIYRNIGEAFTTSLSCGTYEEALEEGLKQALKLI